jgi:integrase
MKMKLSDKGIKALKSPTAARQVDVWDELLPGFGIRVGRRKKMFIVGTRVNGRFKRFTLSPPFPQLSLADARDKARKIVDDAQRGTQPQKLARSTFGAVAADFMRDHASKLRTSGEMQRKLNVELLPLWRDRPMASITRSEIKALLREKAVVSPISANRLLALISKIFTWALDEELIEQSPAMRLPRLGEEHERERTLTNDEIKTAWGAFDRIGYPFGPLFKMLLLTGQRRGEVAGMRWSEIGTEGWRIPLARAKSKQGHLVPLSSLAREVLDSVPHIEGRDHVFTVTADRPLTDWSKAKRRVGGDWRVHDLRRSAATQMRSIGIDRLVVSKILNHAEAGITRVYDRYAADPEKAAALERWAQRLREIVGAKPHQSEVVSSFVGLQA